MSKSWFYLLGRFFTVIMGLLGVFLIVTGQHTPDAIAGAILVAGVMISTSISCAAKKP